MQGVDEVSVCLYRGRRKDRGNHDGELRTRWKEASSESRRKLWPGSDHDGF